MSMLVRFDPTLGTQDLSRHVEATMVDLVTEGLRLGGWFDDGSYTVPVQIVEAPDTATPGAIAPNSVAISVGDESAETVTQLGAGQYQYRTAVFVDVYGENPQVAKSICADVRMLFQQNSALPVYDHSTTPPEPILSDLIEISDTEVERPEASYGASGVVVNWRVVKALLTVTYRGA